MELRIRRDGAIKIPPKVLDEIGFYPETRIVVTVTDGSLVIRKAEMADDPFAAAARGPDTSRLDTIQAEQAKAKERAKERFKELMENPPEVKPEDNPDLWR
ncbi:MAG: hypothetical protein ABFS86_06005 [Planctomycetota bacterium]